jgi:hypoxanthine-DNA glycosylase
LRTKGIALWDVIKSCERERSSDSKIRNVSLNDFNDFLDNHTGIRAIFFNGRTARSIFEKKVRLQPHCDLGFMTLPSTSPANAGMSLQAKTSSWAAIMAYLK